MAKKFQLDKNSDHNFDISKGTKRKFDLKKEVDEPAATPAPQPATQKVEPKPAAPKVETTVITSAEEKKASGGNKILYYIIGLAIVLLLIWWWMKSSKTEPVEAEASQTEQTAEPAEEATEESAEEPVADESVAEEPVSLEPVAEAPAHEVETSAPTTEPAQTVSTPVAASSGDIEAEAMKVIRGEYGTGTERKQRLGDKYAAVQQRVNELKRQGAF